MSYQNVEGRSLDKAPALGQLDFSSNARSDEAAQEISTEPSEAELAGDRVRDSAGDAPAADSATSSAKWPALDKDSPEYAHLTQTAAPTSFAVAPADIEMLAAANRFKPEGRSNVIALAIRGSVLDQPHEQVKQAAIKLTDVRPNHVQFRCTLGFYFRDEGLLTLFTGSTVPCPKYIKNHLHGVGNVGCNMMPTGCYVSRVASHAGGTIRPALRTTNPDDMSSDAVVTVLRTEDDLIFGFGDKDRWDQTTPYDNVHCSYFINHEPSYEASFSSAGCLTVRGRKDPSHQWAKFQDALSSLGQGKHCDLLLLTGREYALAAMLRGSGATPDPAAVHRELVRLRVGSQGDEVSRLQAKLNINATAYFGASTKTALTKLQRQRGIPADGIYSPALDQVLGFEVFQDPVA